MRKLFAILSVAAVMAGVPVVSAATTSPAKPQEARSSWSAPKQVARSSWGKHVQVARSSWGRSA